MEISEELASNMRKLQEKKEALGTCPKALKRKFAECARELRDTLDMYENDMEYYAKPKLYALLSTLEEAAGEYRNPVRPEDIA